MKPHRFILKCVIPLFAIVAAQAGLANDPDLSPSGVISIGDSLTAGLSVTLGGTVRCAAQGNRLLSVTTQNQCRGNGVANVGGWQPSLSQRLSTSIFNNGNSGELTPTISARLGPLLTTQPSTHVLIMTGTNDAIRGDISVALSHIRTMITDVQASGKIPIVATLPPLFGGVESGKNGLILLLNGWILDLPLEFEGLQIADTYARLAPVWSQATSGDFIHLGSLGNALVADEWQQAIDRDIQLRQSGESERRTAAAVAAIAAILLDEDDVPVE